MQESKVSFPAAFKLFFTHYVDFTGRSTRAAYWWWQLWEFLISLLLAGGLIGLFFTGLVHIDNIAPVFWVAFAIVIIALIAWGFGTVVPSYALLVRRFRDAGVSPYWVIATRGLPMVLGQWFAINPDAAKIFSGSAEHIYNQLVVSGDLVRDGLLFLAICLLSLFEFVVTLLPTKHRSDDEL